MKKKSILFVLYSAALLLLSGCQSMQSPQGNLQSGFNKSRISATKDRSGYYDGVAVNDITAQIGMDGSNKPTTYTVPSGSSMKILGRYDGYYVAVLPSNRIGLVPIEGSKPAGSGQSGKTGTNGTAGPTLTPAPTQSGAGSASGAGSTTGGGAATGTASGEAVTMIGLVNQARSQSGLKALTQDSQLTSIAGLKSADMVKNNYFSHNSPTYGSPFDMMKKYGISYLYAGENLAMNQNVQSAENALMNSPDHKANILNPSFTGIGVGVGQKSDGSKIYVQMFIGR